MKKKCCFDYSRRLSTVKLYRRLIKLSIISNSEEGCIKRAGYDLLGSLYCMYLRSYRLTRLFCHAECKKKHYNYNINFPFLQIITADTWHKCRFERKLLEIKLETKLEIKTDKLIINKNLKYFTLRSWIFAFTRVLFNTYLVKLVTRSLTKENREQSKYRMKMV